MSNDFDILSMRLLKSAEESARFKVKKSVSNGADFDRGVPLYLYRKSGSRYVRCEDGDGHGDGDGKDGNSHQCGNGEFSCPGKLTVDLIVVLCWIVRNIGVDVAFTMQEVFRDFHLAGGPVDISDSLLSYHLNILIKNGMFKLVGALESDKRRRVYVITEHGKGCLTCILKLISGDFNTPVTEDQIARQCVLVSG